MEKIKKELKLARRRDPWRVIDGCAGDRMLWRQEIGMGNYSVERSREVELGERLIQHDVVWGILPLN